jgi:hypothetical protein
MGSSRCHASAHRKAIDVKRAVGVEVSDAAVVVAALQSPRPQDPEDAIEDTPVVHAGNAAWFVREHRFDDAPFAIAEFIAHDSMLHFGSKNHAQDQGIKVQTACPLLEGERTYSRHRENDAIDPMYGPAVRRKRFSSSWR